MKILKSFFLTVLILLTIDAFKTDAIPAFARKYRISCLTCHAPSTPKLKAYGDDFAGDGFRLEDYEAPRYYVETGDENLSLIRDFPIAVRLDGFVNYNFANRDKTDFSAPYLVKLLSGGELSEKISYYFYFYMDERRKVAGVEDAFLMYNNAFNQDLDIYLGQFQVSDPLFKRELRMSLEDYRVYTAQIGMSQVGLTYDKGVMITYGLPTSTDVIIEVVNGNGVPEADRFHIFDKDKYKSFVGRISQDIGGFLRVGVFGYYGKEKMTNADILSSTTITNEVMFLGPDLTLTFGDKIEINGQYIRRTDDQVFTNPSSTVAMEDIQTDGILGEIIYSPNGDDSDWYALGMYNFVESDFSPADYQSATFHLGYMLRRNIRLAAEYTQVFTDPDNAFGQVSFGFVSAF